MLVRRVEDGTEGVLSGIWEVKGTWVVVDKRRSSPDESHLIKDIVAISTALQDDMATSSSHSLRSAI